LETGRKPASTNDCHGVTDKNAEKGRRAIPVVGDDGYLDLLDRAFENGHVTERERRGRRLLHFTLRRLGAVPA
jgi:hypothetical protein